ncbi:ribosome hibernation-promoting factor, HPF/YfiA family [Brevibacterium sp. GP-SGM9]|uniref:ribosome hibernation-promoting factor, HPF/YfiA family n=1 Tax=unclassified Brevibacterium TaxID=2614124 RepID=UPI001E60A666|nr:MULTISPECIES: ribosome-associated translation inhibitor RaiA [unclassified Brevibacterium]MCD1284447.1 ribosomal subunit interface protein [Brevibacterium sp. CCUG 69071]MDK8435937.1 ribosome-associated translation inhibitor RaiA [Brevibacterium sp. H-BE7]
MDIVVNGRQLTISDSFRAHIEDKIAKVEQLAPRAQRVEVHVAHEKNSRQPETSERVELTVVAKGPAIRAEAMASDKYAALDLAWAKLVERLRRARDRHKVPRSGHHRKESTAEVLAKMPVDDPIIPAEDSAGTDHDAAADQTNGRIKAEGDSPVVLREKSFAAAPIGIEEALNRMELVGHDFYLFIDEESSKPSVVYRRKGWSYGVIALDHELQEAAD